MATTEVLKKLLDEFTEKEALIHEELKIINEQIEELNKRLGSCRKKLETIGSDRDKLRAMKERYVGFSLINTADKSSDKVSGKAAKKGKEKRLINNAEKTPDISEPVRAKEPIPAIEPASQETPFYESPSLSPAETGTFSLVDVWQPPEDSYIEEGPLSNVLAEHNIPNIPPPPIPPPPPLTREDKGSQQEKKEPSPFESLLDLSSADGTEEDSSNIDKTLSEALKNLWSRDVPPQK